MRSTVNSRSFESGLSELSVFWCDEADGVASERLVWRG